MKTGRRFYIYEKPFKGYVQNTMHNGLVDYTGEAKTTTTVLKNGATEIYTSFKNKLTFEQYQAEKGIKLYIATEKKLDKLLEVYYNSLVSPFKEITEEQFYELLEILPPENYMHHANGCSFRMSEYLTGNLTTHVISFKGHYYSATKRTSENIKDHLNEVINLYNSKK